MQVHSKDLEQIGEFTYRFLRFERYLVDSNFYKCNNRKGFLYPDFLNYCTQRLSSLITVNDLTSFPELKKEIAKRSRDTSGVIDWNTVAPESKTILDFLLKVDIVRDNLFHGSKLLTDKERDIQLIQESIRLLKLIEKHDCEYSKYI